jgi:hypothetical protein
MSIFNKKYEQTLNSIGGTLGTNEGMVYSDNIQVAIEEAVCALQTEANRCTNVEVAYLKGWLAEQWHAETFIVNSKVRSNDNAWARVASSNKTGEDIFYGNDFEIKISEVKYYKNGVNTANAISRPDYISKEKIVPSDQLEAVRESALKKADKIESYRPEQAEHYRDTANRADDRLRIDDVSSKPLDEATAKEMAKDFKKDKNINPDKYGLNSEEFVSWNDIARESGEAAMHAAILSAAISAAPLIWDILNDYVESGSIDINMLTNRGSAILSSSAAAGIRGGIAATLTASCKTGLLGASMKNISPAAIGMATTMTINAIDYSLKLQRGVITQHQFVHYCMKDSFILSSAMVGASVGQLIIPIPLLGALIGNLVGASLGAVAHGGINQSMLGISIENGWTFFGLVKQDYVVSEEVLRQVGYDLITIHKFKVQSFNVNSFEVQSFLPTSFGDAILKRGVIASNTIGYV